MTTDHMPIRDIFSLSVRAAEVFGSREKALRWLETPAPSLGDRTPLSLLSTSEGMADVEDTLGAIEHGIW
jgi:putative toxin-antitoxin system antitoxin component (TIGR02293 family)